MAPRTPPPKNWPRMASSVFYRDATAAIDWLCQAFGFEVRLKVTDDTGQIHHCELQYGDGLVMIGQEGAAAGNRDWKRRMKSPVSLGGATTQAIMFFVDDVDAHCAHARSHGAEIVEEPETHDYGTEYWVDRSYGALDPEGQLWWVTQRLRSGAP